MKKIISLFLSLIIFLGSLCLPVNAASYSDVKESDWFYEPVYRATELGYMSGTGEGKFSPYEPITRAQLCQVLYKLSGEEASFKPYFDDVKENHWYAPAVIWAKEKGITSGTGKDLFSPNALLTREQLAVFYAKYAELYSLELSEKASTEYTDSHLISDWAVASVAKMNDSAIIGVRAANCFLPKGTVSRAELASSLLRLTGDYENGVYDSSRHVELIYTDVNSASLFAGQSISLSVGIWPKDASDKKLTYTSSDSNIASVNEKGKITAKNAGNAVITVKSRDDGHTSVCRITVKALPSFALNKINNLQFINSRALEMNPIPQGRYIDPNKPMVALTYDDGPHPTYTNRILDCLEKYDAVATFFELGNRAVSNPDILRREVALGCEIGNHSYDHPNLATLSAGGVASQIDRTNQIIYNATGVWPELVRPPYGSYNSTVRNNSGAPLIIWSVDTLDWKYRDASYVTSVIKNNVTDGSVILMHSLYSSTAAATEAIVPWLINRGYQLVTVSEMAQARGIKLQDGASYHSFYN